jgi:hypothetical protein
MSDTRKMLLENFDEDVHERLRIQLSDTKAQLDQLQQAVLVSHSVHAPEPSHFDNEALDFRSDFTTDARTSLRVAIT